MIDHLGWIVLELQHYAVVHVYTATTGVHSNKLQVHITKSTK